MVRSAHALELRAQNQEVPGKRVKAFHGKSSSSILVPSEQAPNRPRAKRAAGKRTPGYILVRMALTDKTWHVVMNTPRSPACGGRTSPATIPTPGGEPESQLKEAESRVYKANSTSVTRLSSTRGRSRTSVARGRHQTGQGQGEGAGEHIQRWPRLN